MFADDMTRLNHMRTAAEQACEFIKGRNREDLNRDPMFLHALVRVIEIIGEAARHVSLEVKSKNPDIAWIDIIGMRNRLVHGYFTVDHDVVWDTATTYSDSPRAVEKI
jgi:uncharacterized protein with HEPN domain